MSQKMVLITFVVMTMWVSAFASDSGTPNPCPSISSITGDAFQFGSSCGDSAERFPIYYSTSQSLTRNIISDVNQLRHAVANGNYAYYSESSSGATNMLQLVWSDHLAESVQWRMDRCTPGCSYGSDFRVEMEGDEPQWGKVISFYSQLSQQEYQQLHQMAASYDSSVTGDVHNLAVLLVAGATELGCGALKTQRDNTSYITYACKLNEILTAGQPVYQAGEFCSNCPQGSTCDSSVGCTSGGSPMFFNSTEMPLECHSFSQDPASNPGVCQYEVTYTDGNTQVRTRSGGNIRIAFGASEAAAQINIGRERLISRDRDLCLNATLKVTLGEEPIHNDTTVVLHSHLDTVVDDDRSLVFLRSTGISDVHVRHSNVKGLQPSHFLFLACHSCYQPAEVILRDILYYGC